MGGGRPAVPRWAIVSALLWAGFAAPPLLAQDGIRSLGELEVALYGLTAGVDPLNPIVPKQTASGLRIVVKAGGQPLSSAAVARLLGGPFQVQAELSGPGLPGTLSLPLTGADAVPSPDPLILTFPGLPQSGDYEIANIRLVRAGRPVLDVMPRRVTLRVIEQILVTSVVTRPLTLDEIRQRGVVLDSRSYLGFEFVITLRLESTPVRFSFPAVFDRQGVPVPIALEPPPEPLRSVISVPQLVPLLLKPAAAEGDPDGAPPDYGLEGLGPAGGATIPSLLVIPGSVGWLKQFFSAQLMVGNGAPQGSGLTVRDVTGTFRLPPGADRQVGTEDDPLALPDLESGPQSTTVELVNEAGISVLEPGEFGRAELTLRGEREGRHDVDFDIRAQLDGLPIGSVPLEGRAHGAVLVRNAYFDMTFTVPTVVRADEEFSLFATVTNIGQGAGQDVNVTIDTSRLSGARLLSAATQTIPRVDPGDSQALEYRFRSDVTGEVVASYLRFDTSGGVNVTGRLNFTLGVGERGVAMSPDTLVLPSSIRAIPSEVVRASMRVLGQAWSAANAHTLPPGVERPSRTAVFQKGLAVAEAGLRVELGQAPLDALRDLLLDFHGGLFDAGFDQVLRDTSAGREFDRIVGAALADAAAAGAMEYEETAAQVAASGPPFLSFAVGRAGGAPWPAEVVLVDAAGRRTSSSGLREVPTAVIAALGPAPDAPRLGWLTSLGQPPYTLQLNGLADGSVDLSLTLPGDDGDARHARLNGIAVRSGSHHRLVYDPARAGEIDLETDLNGDGVYEQRDTVTASLLASQGPQLLAAVSVGPETVDGANAFGTYAALLFDRVVSETDAKEVANYEIPNNSVLAAQRQLSGRLVFLAFEQPEGPLVPTRLSVQGIRDERGRGGAPQELPLGSRLTLPAAVVSGRVLQADGSPVADAVVVYLNTASAHAEGRWDCTVSSEGHVAALRTDAAGRFEFRYVGQNPCGGPFRLETTDPQTGALRGVKTYVRVNGQRMVLDLVLIGHGSVTGTVRQALGQPAAGARVRVVSVTDSQIGVVATTDAQGVYSVGGMTVGAVTVTAVHGANLGRGAGRLDNAGGTTTVDVTLDGNVNITGIVRKLEDGVLTPVPGVDVVYYRENAPLGLSVTDSFGRYRLLGVPAGPYRLDAGLNQRDKTSVSGNNVAGQQLVQNLVIEIRNYSNYGTVRGSVTRLDGTPVAQAWVSDNVVATRADDLGRYELLGVALGAQPRAIQAVSPDGRRSGSTSVVLSVPGQVVEGADIEVSGLGAAVFQVVDPAGQPVAGASVGLQGNCLHPCGCRFANTDAQGIARFGDVPFGPVNARAVTPFVPGPRDTALGSAVVNSEDVAGGGIIRLSGFGTATGVVLNPNGTPAHGASVQLTAMRVVVGGGVCGLDQVDLAPVYTDIEGRFQFQDLHVGNVWVKASSSVFPRVVGSSQALSAQGDNVHFELRLIDTMAGVLSGTVWLPDGSAGAGPDVEVTANGPLPPVTVRTDAQGLYSFPPILPAGYYVLTVRDTRPNGTGSMAEARVWLQAAQSARHDVRLKNRGAVSVTVVDGNDVPVENAIVRVQLYEHEFPSRRYEGTINGAGTQPLVFPAVFEGPFSVNVSDNFGRGGRASAAVPPDGQAVQVKVALTTVGRVEGHFLWPDRVTPIPLGTVRLFAGGWNIGQQTSASEGDIGSYSFDYVPAGNVYLDAQDPRSGRTGNASGSIASEGQVLNLDVVAHAVGRVEGVVTLNGDPAPTAEVHLRSGSYNVRVTADGDGRYAVEGVPEGLVYATADLGGGFLMGSAQGSLATEGQTLDLPIALRGAAAIEGRLLAADGETPGAVSLVTLHAYGSRQTTTSDDQGNFRFDLVPEGGVSLDADALASIDCTRQSLSVTGGQTLPVTLTLKGVGALEGTTASSAGPVGGQLSVHGTGPGCQAYNWNLTVGPNGQWRIPELLAGAVSAQFRTSSPGGPLLYANASGFVLPNETTTLPLTVEPSGRVEGRILHQNGTPAIGAQVRIESSAWRYTVVPTGGEGRFVADGVPAGAITVRVTHSVLGGVALVTGQTVVENGTLALGDIPLIETPLAVLSVTPVDGTTEVSVTQPVQIAFNEPLAHNGGFYVSANGQNVGFSAALSADKRTVTLTPWGWPDSREITVEASVWVTDVYGRRLLAPHRSRFRTVDLSPPRVLASTPANNAIQVALDATLSVRFDEALDTGGDLQPIVRVTLGQTPVPGVVTSSAPDTLLFTPSSPLAANALYTVSVNGARDLLDHVQTVAFTSRFMTLDSVVPTLLLTTPPPGGWTNQRRPNISVAVSDTLAGPDTSRAEMRLDGILVPVGRGSAHFNHVPGADLADGVHGVVAFAHDRAGNRGDLAASFSVDTQPPSAPTITAPAANQVLTGAVGVAGGASDVGSGVARLNFLRGGQWVAEATPASGFASTWNTAGQPDGPHLVTAQAVDVAGNVGLASAPVAVVIHNLALGASITSPAADARFLSQVAVTATATEPILRMEFRAGSGPVVVDETAPYEASLDLTAEPEGVVVLSATAVGFAPETATATRTILVDRTPPDPPDPTKVHAEAIAGSALVLGVPGAVEIGSHVEVRNVTTNATNQRAAFADGSFAMRVAGTVGQTLAVTQADEAGNRSNPLVLAIAEAPSEQASVPLEGLALWTRSGEGTTVDALGGVSQWSDRSGQANHVVQTDAAGRPKLARDPVSDRDVLRFDGSNDWMRFSSGLDETLRGVFVVLKQGQSNASYMTVLGDATAMDFWPGYYSFWGGYTNPAVVNGQTWLNGAAVNGSSVSRPKELSVLSVLPTGGVTADRLFTANPGLSYGWMGDVAELIVYTQPLTNTQRKAIEDYLVRRYALYVPQVVAPSVSPDGGYFAGSATVSLASATPGSTIHYTLDGSEPTALSALYQAPFTLDHSATVKARAFRPGHIPSAVTTAGFVSASDFSPRSVAGLALWVATDAGVQADAAGRVSVWGDQSGQGNDLTQSALASRPVLVAGAQNGLPVLRFDGTNDWMQFTTRLNANIRGVFVVLKQGASNASYMTVLGDVTAMDFWPGYYTFWGGYTNPAIVNGQTWLGGVAVNGSAVARPQEMSVLSIVPTAGVTADRLFTANPGLSYGWMGDVAELIVYTQPISDFQRKAVEDYLTLKYAPYVGTAGAPAFSPDGGSFETSVSVSLSAPTPGAQIRYTTDGSEPTAASSLYQSALTLTNTTTVKARSFRAGMNPSPTATARFLKSSDFSPASVSGLALWVAADAGVQADAVGRVTVWGDQSGQGNDLTQATLASRPVLVPGEQNGLPVLRFDGSNDWMRFTNRLDGTIRGVFAVLKQGTSNASYMTVLGDATEMDFWPGYYTFWGGYTNLFVRNGQTWLGGVAVNGSTVARPQSMSVLSVLTTGGVTADRLFTANDGLSYGWMGDIAELIVYTEPLSGFQRKAVEDYLVLKYAPYVATAGAPTFSPNGAMFEASVTVSLSTPTPGGEIRYTTDGSEPTAASSLYQEPLLLTETTTVRARTFRAGMNPSPVSLASFLKQTSFSPASIPGLGIWVRADADVTADAAGRVSAWGDQSPQNNDLTQSTLASQPLLVPGEQNGLPVLRFDGSDDWLQFTSRLNGTIRGVFVVLKQGASNASYMTVLGDVTAQDFWPGYYTFWGGYTNAFVTNGQTWLGGVPVNGSTVARPTTMSVLSLVPTGGVTADRLFTANPGLSYGWMGDVAELIVYTQPISDFQRKAVEDYLTLKYAPYVGTAGAPAFTPNGASFTDMIDVSIATPTPGAEIRYTTDGSEPTATSERFLSPLQLTATTTVKARSYRTGMNPSPTATARFVKSSDFTPASVGGLALWVASDAGVEADAAGRVTVWVDQSGQGNHLTQSTVVSRPVLVPGEQNGLPVLRFDGSNDWMQFTTRLNANIRGVFLVLKQGTTNASYMTVLGDVTAMDFWPGYYTFWGGYTNAFVTNGQTWLGGVPVNGSTVARPATMSVLSLVTTGGVTADRLFTANPGLSYGWMGDVAELIVYTQPISDFQRKAVEDYLTLKYAPYVGTAGAPEFTPNGGTFTSSLSVSLSAPTPGAEIHYTTDGSEPTETSTPYVATLTLTDTTTVKARSFRAGMNASPTTTAHFVRSSDFTPAAVGGLALWVASDAGVQADAAGRVTVWNDRSGQGNHLTQATLASRPVLVPGEQNGLPVLRFDGSNDWMQFTSRLNGTIRGVFVVLKQGASNASYMTVLGDVTAQDFWPGYYTFWGGYTNAFVTNGQTWLGGVPVNGSTVARPTTMSVLSLVPTGGVTADRLFTANPGLSYGWMGDVAELIVYTQPISDFQRKAVEDYLTLKYAPYVGTAGAPAFSPNGGTFTDSVEVSLATPTPGGQIRYTVDGGDPTVDSDLYGGPFTLTTTVTLRARTFRAGMNPSPTTTATFRRAEEYGPGSVPGLALWVASDSGIQADAAGRVNVWSDQSGLGNDLRQTASGSQPVLVPGAQNGLPVMRFDGSNDWLQFTNRLSANIRGVFAVLKQGTSNAQYMTVLGDATAQDFWPGYNTFWGSASAFVTNGQTWLNDAPVNGSTVPRPQTMSVLSLLTTGGVTADRLFIANNGLSYGWMGDIAELIVYTQPLTGTQRKGIEDYLALKYGLSDQHPWAAGTPEITPANAVFDTSITVSMSTPTPGAEIRYTLDGSEPTDISELYTGPFELAWSAVVQARAFHAGMSPSPIAVTHLTRSDHLSPAAVPGLALWARADIGLTTDAADRVSVWRDLSGRGNDLKQPTAAAQPTSIPDGGSGTPVVRFDGVDDNLFFTSRLTTIRTVFWVFREEASATVAPRHLLGDASSYAFHAGPAKQIWHGTYTDSGILAGETRINSVLVNGTSTDRPTTLSVVSLVTTNPVAADAFNRDRSNGRYWWGDLAEVIVYDRPLTNAERKGVEDYLALKHALYVPTISVPSFTPPGSTTVTPVDVSLASSTPGAEIHYTTDGSEPTEASQLYTAPFLLSSPTTVKARAFRAGWNPSPIAAASFLDTTTPAPLRVAGLKLWVKADAGVTATAGSVSSWADQSGNGNHLVQPTAASQPQLVGGAENGLPAVRLDGVNDVLSFTSRLTTIRTVFWVLRSSVSATPGYRFLLGDVTNYDFCSGSTTKIWDASYTSAFIKNGETRLNGTPINGLTTDRPTASSVISLVTTGNVTADALSRDRAYGRSWWGDVMEIAIYDRVLSAAERQSIEGYLAAKYALYVPTVSAPSISPAGGSVSGIQVVTMDDATPDATIRYTLDDSEPTESSTEYTGSFEVTETTRIRAKAFRAGWNPSSATVVTFYGSEVFTPASVPNLALWVRSDAGPPLDSVSVWPDQGPLGNDLIQSEMALRPVTTPDAVSRMPLLRFDGVDDTLLFETRASGIRTVFWVIRRSSVATNGYRFLLGDAESYHFHSNGTTKLWDGNASASVRGGQLRINAASILAGTTADRPTALSVISLVTTGNVAADAFSRDRGNNARSWWGDIGELVIYDRALSESEVEDVEEYLAGRFGITLTPP